MQDSEVMPKHSCCFKSCKGEDASQADPARNEALLDHLAAAEAKLDTLQERLANAKSAPQAKEESAQGSSKGRFLGKETTKLEATVKSLKSKIQDGYIVIIVKSLEKDKACHQYLQKKIIGIIT